MKPFDHHSGDWLHCGDARIYYESSGREQAPVLLLLHGGFGNVEDFNGFLAGFDGDFRIIGIDSRGHGKSTLGSKPLCYAQIAEDVEQVLAHLGIDRLSIIGFSDGGIVAYRMAASSRLNIDKLVTIGSHWRLKADDPTRTIFSAITPQACRSDSPDAYATYQAFNPEPDFDRFIQSVVDMWLSPSASGYPNQAVESITCPVLIVRGDGDHLFSLEDATALRALLQQSVLFNIPFAGHSAFAEQPELFLSGLLQFLK